MAAMVEPIVEAAVEGAPGFENDSAFPQFDDEKGPDPEKPEPEAKSPVPTVGTDMDMDLDIDGLGEVLKGGKSE
jgi:hypothetical protein